MMLHKSLLFLMQWTILLRVI